jgi:hypothetical protein
VVKDGTSTWTLVTRYSKLHDLGTKLQSRYPEVKFAPFPPKTAFWEDDTSPSFIESRRTQLEVWFQRILSEAKLLQSPEVRSFLDPTAATVSTCPPSPSPSPSFRSLLSSFEYLTLPFLLYFFCFFLLQDKNPLTSSSHGFLATRNDPRVFLLPPPPSTVYLPEVLEYQGETYFLAPLISEMKDNLELLAVLKYGLEKAAPVERLDILERSRERSVAVVAQLRDEQKVLSKLLQSSPVASAPSLYEYLDDCASQAQKAVEWYGELETIVVERLTSEGETGEKTKLEQRMKIYEEMIDNLVTEAFTCATPDKRLELEAGFEVVLEKIQQDRALAASVMEVEGCADKLKALYDYAMVNFEAIKQQQEISPENHVGSLEARMFAILDSVSSIEGSTATNDAKGNGNGNPPEDQAQISRNTTVHSQITKLIKDLSSCKNVLVERYGFEEKKHLLNRVEDLQENLGDLEHNFLSKHKVERGLGGFAFDMIKERLVTQARQVHQDSESDLFEL